MILDALVVGGGPAGCASAICLAEAGLAVGIAARPDAAPDKLGESLSRAAGPLLRRLGVRAAFAADGHLPCHANASAWGSDDLAYHDFLERSARARLAHRSRRLRTAPRGSRLVARRARPARRGADPLVARGRGVE